MAEFCGCGSIIVNGHCTNKNCSLRPASVKSPAAKRASAKSSSAEKKEPKSTKVRRASKCIVYNMYDMQKENQTTEE